MNTSIDFAIEADNNDPLKDFRRHFHIPVDKNGDPVIYLCGNSLGLMPKTVRDYVLQELDDWQCLGVEGHVHAKHPWVSYHELLTESMAEVVGALAS
jgi:kynureninase